MPYSVEFSPQAEQDFLRLDKIVAANIAGRIDWLAQNMASVTPAPLKGKFKGKYKLRVGDWRVVYSFEHSSRIIIVYAVRHRSEVYKM